MTEPKCMNRKPRDRESPLKSGPEHAGNQPWSDPGRYLEYENIPDPISFEDTGTGLVQTAANNDENGEEKKISGDRR